MIKAAIPDNVDQTHLAEILRAICKQDIAQSAVASIAPDAERATSRNSVVYNEYFKSEAPSVLLITEYAGEGRQNNLAADAAWKHVEAMRDRHATFRRRLGLKEPNVESRTLDMVAEMGPLAR